jgi:magnesium-transporting ATPase (P-type)
MIDNWFFFLRFIITLACFLVFLGFLIPRQTKEVLLPADGLTKLRYWLLGVLLLIVLTLIPSITYQLFVAFGHEYKALRNIASIIGGVNLVGMTVLFVLIYTYRRNDE